MDPIQYMKYLLTLIIVLAFILVCSWVLKRFSNGARGATLFGRSKGGKRSRLSVEETITVDTRRRLVLVRRGDVRHLLLVGGANDLILETFLDDDTTLPAAAGPPRPADAHPVLKERA